MFKKVLYLIESMAAGGTEKHLSELAPALRQRGFEPVIWVRSRWGHFADRLKAQGIPVLHVPRRRLGPRLFRFLLANPDTLVHSYLFADHLEDVLAARLARAKYVKSTRNQGLWFVHGGAITRLKARLRTRWIPRHLVNSSAVKEYLINCEHVESGRISIIHNGVMDCHASAPRLARADVGLRDSDFVLVLVSRLKPFKNVDFLVSAMPELLRRIPEAKLLVIGDGMSRVKLEHHALESGVAWACRFIGFKPDPIPFLRLGDVFVQSSLSEGMANSVIEAAMMGLPAVLCREAAGNSEIIEYGETGFLYSTRSPEQFVGQVVTLHDDEGLRSRMGRSARKRYLAHFTFERQVEDFIRFYDKIRSSSG